MNILLKSNKDHDAVPLNSFLFYLVDGIIPLVTSFCYQLRDHSSSSLTTESYSSLFTPRVVSVLKSINDAAAVSNLIVVYLDYIFGIGNRTKSRLALAKCCNSTVPMEQPILSMSGCHIQQIKFWYSLHARAS